MCPGDLISYTCIPASPGSIHIWRGTVFSGQCSGEDILISSLSSSTDEIGESGSCGVFTATVTNVTNGISSELTFTASVDLDGLAVECAGGDFSTTILQVVGMLVSSTFCRGA